MKKPPDREPDTVRGAGVMYDSYQRTPTELDPDDYREVPPEIIWDLLPANVGG